MGNVNIDAAEYERLIRDSEKIRIARKFLVYGSPSFMDENIRTVFRADVVARRGDPDVGK